MGPVPFLVARGIEAPQAEEDAMEFSFERLFQLGRDSTSYRLLTKDTCG